ncbi:MAG: hypothetical protein EXR05_09345 [Acetobacteraceae bacterium]|nr:hypothetical protein [Acetobacteraceae bacterium]MSP30992.1 hypothetical protein [Acetobacteraceae bacterium]
MHDLQSPPPHASVLRALRQPDQHVHLGTEIMGPRRTEDGVVLNLSDGLVHADLLIVATDFAIDLAREPILADFYPYIATWAHAYALLADLMPPELGRFPWLGAAFALTERAAGACPALGRIHLFSLGAMASVGQIASDIPGVNIATAHLASHLTQQIAREGFLSSRTRLGAFYEPELKDMPFYVASSTAPIIERQPRWVLLYIFTRDARTLPVPRRSCSQQRELFG